MKVSRIVILATVAAFGAGGEAEGAMITFHFSGNVTQIIDWGGAWALNGRVAVGDHFSGQVTFDSNMPDLKPADPVLGQYKSLSTSLTVMVGQITISVNGDALRINVANHPVQGDSFSLDMLTWTIIDDLQIQEFNPLSLSDSDGLVFTTDALPITVPDLNAFDSARRRFSFAGSTLQGQGFVVLGEVKTLTPEPSSLSLLVLGLLTAARRTRRFSAC